jgi:hypothetical protein
MALSPFMDIVIDTFLLFTWKWKVPLRFQPDVLAIETFLTGLKFASDKYEGSLLQVIM